MEALNAYKFADSVLQYWFVMGMEVKKLLFVIVTVLPLTALAEPDVKLKIIHLENDEAKPIVHVVIKNETYSDLLIKRHGVCAMADDVYVVYSKDGERQRVKYFVNYGRDYYFNNLSSMYHFSISPGGQIECSDDLSELYEFEGLDGLVSIQLVLAKSSLPGEGLICSLSSNVITIDLDAGGEVENNLGESSKFNSEGLICEPLEHNSDT